MHIRIDYRNGGKRHIAYCSVSTTRGKPKNPKCHSPHIMDADLLMQTVSDVLKKIAEYSISNRADFEALVKKSLAVQQTDQTKKQQKRVPQITTRLEQIERFWISCMRITPSARLSKTVTSRCRGSIRKNIIS